jgi:hypothetical protein
MDQQGTKIMKRILVLAAAALLVGCESMGEIKESSVWLTIPVRGTPVEAVNCLAQQFRSEHMEVRTERDSMDVFIVSGPLVKTLHPLYHIDAKQTQAGPVAEIRVGTLIIPSVAERDARNSVSVCA